MLAHLLQGSSAPGLALLDVRVVVHEKQVVNTPNAGVLTLPLLSKGACIDQAVARLAPRALARCKDCPYGANEYSTNLETELRFTRSSILSD
jgi:hypothetical protein